jgi:hypothetical protein
VGQLKIIISGLEFQISIKTNSQLAVGGVRDLLLRTEFFATDGEIEMTLLPIL